MIQPTNTSTTVGRLAADPRIFTNQDGSTRRIISVYPDRNEFSSGKKITDPLDFEQFIPAGGKLGAFGFISAGDHVMINATRRTNHYRKTRTVEVTLSDGSVAQGSFVDDVYEDRHHIEQITVLSSKAESTARRTRRDAAAQSGQVAENAA